MSHSILFYALTVHIKRNTYPKIKRNNGFVCVHALCVRGFCFSRLFLSCFIRILFSCLFLSCYIVKFTLLLLVHLPCHIPILFLLFFIGISNKNCVR